MAHLKYTLIGDGSSDKVLIPVINWLINDLYPELPTSGIFADFGRIKNPPTKGDIKGQVKFAAHFYPFDILIYHRDAESNSNDIINIRKSEILSLITEADYHQRIVCVVPIVMTEAWLLIDQNAIKKAAGNRNYPGILNLPSIPLLEQQNDPKELLFCLLRTAKNAKKRELYKFNPNAAVHWVAEYISDFSSLRQLRSFQQFELDLTEAIDSFLKQQSIID